ncbi:hypothetical protein MJO28_009655 [Puccinia striiformis f. sp. tritici]|uniref:Uncharacterized protein n=1 Tax=Puccinia striiformis f. sp. tritici TaxID=168172 RepID=A0ACC0E909_9BASI|nr:hypothetical protein MJO28_009655 [Puccinia striiformis f. sp. tritici]
MNHQQQQQHYKPYTSSSSSTSTTTTKRQIIEPPSRSNTSTPTSLRPFRSGFQAKGVYRDRTDLLISFRNSKQESKRLEESRLQKRLEKLINLHFPKHSTTTVPTTEDSGISGKLLGFGQKNRIRSVEQSIVRWQDDSEVIECKFCATLFGLRVRKHHCRLCGTVVCFSPPSSSSSTTTTPATRNGRCSTMIRFEWESGITPPSSTEKSAVKGRVVQLEEHEMGIVDDSHSVLDLIQQPATTTSKPRTGVRVCTACLAVILRRQAMTYPPSIPEYCNLYQELQNIQLQIQAAIPEFQELLSFDKNKSSLQSNLNPSKPKPENQIPIKLLTIRKRLLTNLTIYDSLTKKLISSSSSSQVPKQGKGGGKGREEKSSEIRLVTAITTRAGLFLRDHMSLIRTLGLLEIDHSSPKPSSSKPSTSKPSPSKPSPSSSISTTTRHPIQNLSFSEDINTEGGDTNLLVQLNVLLEQENRIEGFRDLAISNRQLDDVASLTDSLLDLRQEISHLKTLLS